MAKEVRLYAALAPGAVVQLARLAHGKDGKLAYLDAVALLDRGYGLPV